MRATFLVGTRPEILKIYPVVLAARRHGLPYRIVHSGQHYDYRLSEIFFTELTLPKPSIHLRVGSGPHAHQIAQTLLRLERMSRHDPLDNLIVVGDTNTVLAGALFASRKGLPLFHIEAGARCYDPGMPEEQNRLLTDHLADVLFAPTRWNREALLKESVRGRIHITGNPIIDACVRVLSALPRNPAILDHVPFEEFALVTAHRSEIVDNPLSLSELVKILLGLPIPVVFPCHPRTAKRLRKFGFMAKLRGSRNVLLLPPLGYSDFLGLMQRSSFIISDSGGVTEEATSPGLNKIVFSPRKFTELPEAVESGHLTLVGAEHRGALIAIRKRLDSSQRPRGHPYGTGHSGEKIARLIEEYTPPHA